MSRSLYQSLMKSALRRRYLDGLFPAQRAFFDDPSKTKGAYCSRRSGKTWVCSAGLYDACEDVPESASLYVALTGKSARHILWPILRKFDRTYHAGLRFNDTELIATAPNGSQIMLTGADQIHKIEALRGRAFRRVVIDEAQAFPKRLLRYLLDDVLEASLMDLDGDTWLIGTPNAARAGHFYDLLFGAKDIAKIPSYSWTVLQNPHIPHAERWLEALRKKHNWTLNTPVYQREYMGRWVRDESSLVFRFDRNRHIIDALPKLDRCVGGADIGTAENERTTALVHGGWARHDRAVYVAYAKKYAAMNPSSMGDEMRALGPALLWMLDEGGLGKGYGDEFRKRQQGVDPLNVRAAKKQNKHAYIEHCNGEFDGGRIKLLAGKCDDLIDELELLQWDEDHKEYDKSFADHACDAFLYMWRDCWSFAEEELKTPGPLPGSTEFLLEQMERHRREAITKAKDRERGRRKWTGTA